MALSKEFYLDEIRSKYPNSYNEGLKDLPVKDLEDMLDFLDQALGKADGGSIGIEVLFGPKRGEYQTGGQAYDSRATAQDFAKALGSVSAGTTYQQQADAKRYARQQAASMLDQAMKSADPSKGPGLQGIYDTFFKNKLGANFQRTFTPGASGRMMGYATLDRDKMLDQMANQMLDTTQYSQSKVNERREKEYADFMNNLIASTYGKADDYRAEAMTLGMPTEAYFDYLVTSDPKDKLSTRDVLSRDPYFDPKTYVPTDYSNPETPRPPSPYEVYFQQELQNQINAGIPVGQRIQRGQVLGLPTLAGPGSQMGPGYESYADVVARNKKMMGLKDGGRVGLFMGGPALEGQALSIYNSMNAYGFSDQEIADALSARGLYTPAGSGSGTGTGTGTTTPNIIGAQLNQGDDRVTELQETFTKDLSGDPRFNYLEPTAQANKYRFDRSVEPRDGLLGFFDSAMNKMKESSFFQPKIRGTLGTRMANQPRIPLPAAIAAYSRSPFNIKSSNYNPLMEAQLNFAETQKGIIGRDPNSGLLKYGPESVLAGKNVISMFGTNDYEQALKDYITKMNANKKISATTKAAKLAQAQKELEELQKKTEAARAAQYGAIDYGRGSDGQRSYSGDAIGAGNLGFGVGATTGGPVSNRTGRGRQDYSKGGLATMFTRRR